MWKGAETGLERGKNGVGTGAKTDFKRHKKTNLARFDNLEQRRTVVPCCSTSFEPFLPFHPFFHPFLTIFAKNGKKVVREWRNGKEKKSVLSSLFPVPIFFLSFLGTSLVHD